MCVCVCVCVCMCEHAANNNPFRNSKTINVPTKIISSTSVFNIDNNIVMFLSSKSAY